ncbi:MAG: hypothetical protein OXC05_14925 [Halieaceae bacterium]|nr:hypothetical protein [Halieaceae bacterium]
MATEEKTPVKKAATTRTATKSTASSKTAPKKTEEKLSLRESAEKAVNVYLGLIGKGLDVVQENFASARKDNVKRLKDLEKRGAKLRKDIEKRTGSFEVPELKEVFEDPRAQFSKFQDRVENAVENARDKLSSKKAA